jgi:hypothetical protein
MKTRVLLTLFFGAITGTAYADADWIVISDYGQLATVHTANVKLADNLWEHTATIRPLSTDEGIRIWCNGVELPTAIISDSSTFHCKDKQQGSNWEWRFNIDVNGEPENVNSYTQKVGQTR